MWWMSLRAIVTGAANSDGSTITIACGHNSIFAIGIRASRSETTMARVQIGTSIAAANATRPTRRSRDRANHVHGPTASITGNMQPIAATNTA